MLNTKNPDANISLIRGLRFRFILEGKELLYFVSAWSGKESIVYDGEEISTLQSYKKKTIHNFVIDDVAYKMTYTVNSSSKVGWHCCLFRNERMVKCFDLYFDDLSFTKKLLYGATLGILVLFIPKYLWFIWIPLIGVVSFRLVLGNIVCKVRLGD